jgi:hypothetical protein
MLDGLTPTDAMRCWNRGGPHRRLGCGVFVPTSRPPPWAAPW